MKIRGNTVGTTLRPEKNLVKATDLTPEEQAQARANIGAPAYEDLSNYYNKEEIAQMVSDLGLDDIPSTAFVWEEGVRAAEYVVNREMGDISSALTELHEYAEALKGGGSV